MEFKKVLKLNNCQTSCRRSCTRSGWSSGAPPDASSLSSQGRSTATRRCLSSAATSPTTRSGNSGRWRQVREMTPAKDLASSSTSSPAGAWPWSTGRRNAPKSRSSRFSPASLWSRSWVPALPTSKTANLLILKTKLKRSFGWWTNLLTGKMSEIKNSCSSLELVMSRYAMKLLKYYLYE